MEEVAKKIYELLEEVAFQEWHEPVERCPFATEYRKLAMRALQQAEAYANLASIYQAREITGSL